MADSSLPVEADELRIYLLGGFRVLVGRRVIPESAWRLRKAQSLLKLLALTPTHRLHREQLLDCLWPDHDPAAATNNLHRVLHHLRHLLQPTLAPGQPSAYLRWQDAFLVLSPAAPLWVDVDAFLAAGQAAHRRQDPAAYAAALARYTGVLLPEDRYADWAASRREELRQHYLRLLSELAQLQAARRDYPAAIATLERLVASEPTLEAAQVSLMRLYAQSGQRYQALRQYQHLRAALRRELAAEPAAATQRLYQAIRTGQFPPGHPPPAAGPPAAAGSPLPSLLTPFVGRARELEQIPALLAGTRLLTLIGAGGSGKTRLALEVAARLVSAYAEGVWLVDLAALSDPQLVPQAVARVLGVREQAGHPLLETLTDCLRSRQLLLVLDNCEHLVETCASLAGKLLAACPQLAILATSRQALGIAGETIWRVSPLATPDPERLPPLEQVAHYDAIRLFVARVAASWPGFALTPANAAAVVQICQRLDGLPLALELAAGRVRLLGVEELAARLDAALGWLTGGSRTAPARQQTVRATLAWSYELLGTAERVLLRRLAVFAGSWTLAAAEGVCSGDGLAGAILEVLGQLVEQSLVEVVAAGESVRYRLLEVVRQYAWEQLQAAGEEAARRRRQAGWYLGLVEEAEAALLGPEQGGWLERLAAEQENVRAVLRWAVEQGEVELGLRLAGALWRFWDIHGHLSEGRYWLEALLARGGTVAAAVQAKALRGAGILALDQGDYVQATVWLKASLALYRELGDRLSIARVLNNLGTVALNQGDYQQAATVYEEGLVLAQEAGDRPYISILLNNLGLVALYQDNYGQAVLLFREGLALARELGNQDHIARILKNLGDTALCQDDYGQAKVLYIESLALRRDQGDKEGAAYCVEGLAAVARAQGQSERAVRLWGAAEALREAIGAPLPPALRASYGRAVAAARAQLGEDAFVQIWEEGRAMSPEQAIAEALTPEPPAPAPATRPQAAAAGPAPAQPSAALSEREREIAALIAAGRTNREIAAALMISQRTVDTHISHILDKLGFTSRTQIAAWAKEQGLVPISTS